MASDKAIEARRPFRVAERAFVSLMQPDNLLKGEIAQWHLYTDIERALVQVRDEQTCLGRVRQYQRQLRERPLRVQRSLVMPCAHLGEDLAVELTREDPIGLIDRPDDRAIDLRNEKARQKPVEVVARRQGRTKGGDRIFGEARLIRQPMRQRGVERLRRA